MDESPSENFYEELKPQLHRRIARTLRGSKKVVDLGCGSCDLAQFLAKSNRQEVIGIDISDASFPPEAQMSSAQGEKVRCVKKDAGALSFLVADSMDAVVTMWALHEMSSPIRVLREARRILRPFARSAALERELLFSARGCRHVEENRIRLGSLPSDCPRPDHLGSSTGSARRGSGTACES